MSEPATPMLSTQLIGQAETALTAILDQLLDEAGLTFGQWLVLVVTAGSSTAGSSRPASQETVAARIAAARDLPRGEILAAVGALAAAGLMQVAPGDDGAPILTITATGEARFGALRRQVEEITARLFDLPQEDLVTAGRVLSIVAERARTEASSRR